MNIFDAAFTSRNKSYRKANKKASGILQDPDRLKKLLMFSAQKLNHLRQNTDSINSLKQTVPTLNRMLKAYIQGDYQKLPWKSLLLLTSGIVYFVSPVDLIPDFIPLTGFLDDITIILWILNAVKDDVEDFEEWESSYAKSSEE